MFELPTTKICALLRLLLASSVVSLAQCFVVFSSGLTILSQPKAYLENRPKLGNSETVQTAVRHGEAIPPTLQARRSSSRSPIGTCMTASPYPSVQDSIKERLKAEVVVGSRVAIQRRVASELSSATGTARTQGGDSAQGARIMNDNGDVREHGNAQYGGINDIQQASHKKDDECRVKGYMLGEEKGKNEGNVYVEHDGSFEDEKGEGDDREKEVLADGTSESGYNSSNWIPHEAEDKCNNPDTDLTDEEGEERQEELKFSSYPKRDGEQEIDRDDQLYHFKKLGIYRDRIDNNFHPPPLREKWETTSFPAGDEFDYTNFSQYSFHVDLPIVMGNVDEEKKRKIQPAIKVLGGIATLIDTTDDVFSFKYLGFVRNRAGIEAWARHLVTTCYPAAKDVKMVTNRQRDARDSS